MVLGPSALAEGSVGESGGDVKLLPFHRFEINSPLDRQAALAAMAAHTEDRKWFRWRWPNSKNDDRFEGQLNADGFHVRRIIGYRNSFLPVVDGVVHASGRGSRVEITMRPFVFVVALVGITSLPIFSIAISTGDSLGFLIAGGLLLFIYAMTMGGFWLEAAKQEQTLRQIFQER
jgi:hypothetical protein